MEASAVVMQDTLKGLQSSMYLSHPAEDECPTAEQANVKNDSERSNALDSTSRTDTEDQLASETSRPHELQQMDFIAKEPQKNPSSSMSFAQEKEGNPPSFASTHVARDKKTGTHRTAGDERPNDLHSIGQVAANTVTEPNMNGGNEEGMSDAEQTFSVTRTSPREKGEQSTVATGVTIDLSSEDPNSTLAKARANSSADLEFGKPMLYIIKRLQDQKTEPIQKLAIPSCQVCSKSSSVDGANLSIVQCGHPDCTIYRMPLCSNCFREKHTSSTDAVSHAVLDTSKCPLCQLSSSAFLCLQCDLHFCKTCFDSVHSVGKTKTHERMCLENAPGSSLVKGGWSKDFQKQVHSTVSRKAAGEKSYADVSQTTHAGQKRPRPTEKEVILIDDSDDEEPPSTIPKISAGQTHSTIRPSSSNSAPAYLQPINPVVFSDAATGLASEPLMSTVGTAYPDIGFSAESSSVSRPVFYEPRNSVSSNTSTSSRGSTPIGSGEMASSNLTPRMVSFGLDEDALDEVCYKNYLKENFEVVRIEGQMRKLNADMLQASSVDMSMARGIQAKLYEIRRQLQTYLEKRQLALVNLVLQVPVLMEKVKQLRLSMLGDIPQVVAQAHWKGLQLAKQVILVKRQRQELQRQLTQTMEMISNDYPDLFHERVSYYNLQLQTADQSISRLKTLRDDEAVRVVQYSEQIRELLKAEFRRHSPRTQQRSGVPWPATPLVTQTNSEAMAMPTSFQTENNYSTTSSANVDMANAAITQQIERIWQALR